MGCKNVLQSTPLKQFKYVAIAACTTAEGAAVHCRYLTTRGDAKAVESADAAVTTGGRNGAAHDVGEAQNSSVARDIWNGSHNQSREQRRKRASSWLPAHLRQHRN